MNQPENVPHCRFFTEFDNDSFESHWQNRNVPGPEIRNQPNTDIQFNISMPFNPSENDFFSISVAAGAEPHDYILYRGIAHRNMDLTVLFPLREEWPDGGYLDFALFMPEKEAICVWGGEELLLLEGPDHPRRFNIELLPNVYVEEETGARRRTIITPIR